MDTLLYEDETFEEMQNRAKSEKFAFPYLQDAEQTVGKDFGVSHTPQAFIIWKEQEKWVVRYSGAIDDNGAEPQKAHSFIEQALSDLLAGKTVRTPKTKSLGCSVYFRKTN